MNGDFLMSIMLRPRLARLLLAAHAAMACLAAAPPVEAAFSCTALELKSATLRFGAAGDARLTLRGTFTLTGGQSIDPAAETVVISMLDRGGMVFMATLPPGAFRANAAATSWRFSDPSGQQARGLTSVRMSSPDRVHFDWKVQGRNVDLAAANELELEVIVAVGDDCVRAVEPCNRGRNGRSLTCKMRSAQAPSAAAIEVATRGRTSPLPEAVSVGALGWDAGAPWQTLQPYVPAAHLGQVRLYTLDPSWFFDRTATTPPTEQQWQATDQLVRDWAVRELKSVVTAGYEPSVSLTGMPRWLSSRLNDESVHPNGDWLIAWVYAPPASLSEWYDLVYRFVSIIAAEGFHPPYQVWDEPNWMFSGTLADYYDLYEVTASAVRAADPLATVGGPGLSGFGAGKDSGWASPQAPPPGSPVFLPAWIAEMGRRGAPIDFVDWHFPTADPGDGRIDTMAALARSWLVTAGYDPGVVRLRIGEWLKDNCGQTAADLPSAAEVVPMLGRLADAGFASHTHTSFTDQSNWSDGCWTHVGLFSGADQHPHFLVRAKLNVFRLVSWLGATQLPIALRDAFVEGIATQSAGGYDVVLANFVSVDNSLRMPRRAVAELCATSGLGLTPCDALAACATAALSTTAVRSGQEFQACVEAALTPAELDLVTVRTDELKAEAVTRQATDWSGIVRLAGLRSGVYDVERALVDRSHGNVCAYNKATEPVPSADACGAGGAVDQAWAAVVAAAEDAGRAVLRSRGYSDVAIATIEAAIVNPCRESSTQEAFDACVDAAVPAVAAQLGRNAATMTADLLASLEAYQASHDAGEIAAAATLNALPEVTSRLDPAGQATVAGSRLDLDVTLPPNGVLLLRLRRAQ